MSNKQNTVSLSQEQKAVLAAFKGLVSALIQAKGVIVTIASMISGGILSAAQDFLKQPENPRVVFYFLDEEDGVKSALVNRSPSEIKDRDIPVVFEEEIGVLDDLQKLFGKDWVVESGKLKGRAFSYKGKEGRQRLIFSRTVDYVIQNYFKEIPHDWKSEKNFALETKGEYLQPGDVLHFIMCETTEPIKDDSNQVVGYKFNWYDLTINIKTKEKHTRAGGSERAVPEREIPVVENVKTVDFDLELEL